MLAEGLWGLVNEMRIVGEINLSPHEKTGFNILVSSHPQENSQNYIWKRKTPKIRKMDSPGEVQQEFVWRLQTSSVVRFISQVFFKGPWTYNLHFSSF